MAPTSSTNGIWGHPTSTLDWCEKNYEVSGIKSNEVSKSRYANDYYENCKARKVLQSMNKFGGNL